MSDKKTCDCEKGNENDDVMSMGMPVSLRGNGHMLFTYPVNSMTVHPVMDWILMENLAEEKKEFLHLFINSPGGSIVDCFALTDVMEASSIPIRTTGIGMIASCGLLIFIAGAKGHRIITPNTAILSHQFSAGMRGKQHELLASTKRFDQVGEQLVRHYRKHTKLPVARIRKELMPAEDRWLTPKEAIKFNLADKVKKLGK